MVSLIVCRHDEFLKLKVWRMVNRSNPPTTIVIIVIGRNSGKTGSRSWEWTEASIPPSSLELSFHSTAISIVQCEDHLQESLSTLFVLSWDCSGAGVTMHAPAGSGVVTGAPMHDRSADRSAGVSRQRDCLEVVREILSGSPAVTLSVQCAYKDVHTKILTILFTVSRD